MAKELDFDTVSSEISKLEKSLVPFHSYSEDVSLELGIKISPSEYSGLTYQDLLNFYDRIKKIKKTAEIVRKVSVKKSKESAEAEIAIKEISKEPSTLTIEKKDKKALESEIKFERMEEVPRPSVPEPTIPKPKIPEKEKSIIPKEKKEEKAEVAPELEFDIPAPELGVIERKEEENVVSPVVFESVLMDKKKKEKEKKVLERETGERELVHPEKPETTQIQYIISHKHPEITRFPSIEQDPNELAIKRYNELVAKIESSPKKMSTHEIKSKMLSLTKQLFKEKLTSEREKIKKEVIALKNILSSNGKVKKMDLKTLVESLSDEFNSELIEYTTALENLVHHTVLESEKDFHDALSDIPMQDKENRKKAFELFSSDLSHLTKQTSDFTNKTSDFLIKFHVSAIEQIKQMASPSEIRICNKLILNINKNYKKKFVISFSYLKEFMEVVRLRSSHDIGVLTDTALKPLFEALEMNEEQLLNYLQSNHPKNYDSYLHKNMGKMEAIYYARRMLAKEKGLSNELLSKYFHMGR